MTEKPDILGFTPLMRLLQEPETTLKQVKKMVKDGADVKYKAPCGETPLTIAHRYSNYSIVKYLIANGADPEHALYQGRKRQKEELDLAALPELEEDLPQSEEKKSDRMEKIMDFLVNFSIAVGVFGTIVMLSGLVGLLTLGGYTLCQ